MDSNNQVASSENNQTNLCDGPPSTDLPNMTMEIESFRSESNWNPLFDEKIFHKPDIWLVVKTEHKKMWVNFLFYLKHEHVWLIYPQTFVGKN